MLSPNTQDYDKAIFSKNAFTAKRRKIPSRTENSNHTNTSLRPQQNKYSFLVFESQDKVKIRRVSFFHKRQPHILPSYIGDSEGKHAAKKPISGEIVQLQLRSSVSSTFLRCLVQ